MRSNEIEKRLSALEVGAGKEPPFIIIDHDEDGSDRVSMSWGRLHKEFTSLPDAQAFIAAHGSPAKVIVIDWDI